MLILISFGDFYFSGQSSTIDFALCLGATATEKQAARTRAKSGANSPLDKKDEVVANVIWRFLELRGLVPFIEITIFSLVAFLTFVWLTIVSLILSPVWYGFQSSPHSFINKSHEHQTLARAMYGAISRARLNDKFQDPLYLFLELVRAGVMHGHLWSGRAFSGGPSFGTGASQRQ